MAAGVWQSVRDIHTKSILGQVLALADPADSAWLCEVHHDARSAATFGISSPSCVWLSSIRALWIVPCCCYIQRWLHMRVGFGRSVLRARLRRCRYGEGLPTSRHPSSQTYPAVVEVGMDRRLHVGILVLLLGSP